MREEPDLMWCLEAIEKELSKHHSPANNIMNIVSHVKFKVSKLISK